MAIPFWRNKTDTDDGCSIYQCLSCYGTWEARTSPQREGYNSGFVYCPCCGIKWEGEIEYKEEEWRNEFYDRRYELQKEIETKKHWWVLLVSERDLDDDAYLKPIYKVEAGGKYPTKAIRNWFISQKKYYLNKCYSRHKVVKLVLSKDLKKDFPFHRNISEESSNVLRGYKI